MNSETQVSETGISFRTQPTRVVRRFISLHKSPVIVVFLSAIIGILAGLLCTFFDIAISWVVDGRTELLDHQGVDLFTIIVVCLSSAA